MPQPFDWNAYTRDTLANTDIRAAYESWGVEFVKSTPNAKGWLDCWARDRPHGDRPNAGVNVKDGYYKDHGGSAERLSLWEFGAKYGGFRDWRACRDHFAEKAGLTPPGKNKKKAPDDRLAPEDYLQFLPWNDLNARLWAQKRPPIDAAVLQTAGMRKAIYRGAYVFVTPVYNALPPDRPCGWVAVDMAGGFLVHKPRDGAPEKLKVKTVDGSSSGLLGQLAQLRDAEVVWKVEGVTDLYSLMSVIPADLRGRHVVVTNSGGASQRPDPLWVSWLAGKVVHVVHDCDVPGREGAKKWLGALAGRAQDVKDIVLPYPVVRDHGKDLRDFLRENAVGQRF
jgi:hypothetical protein